MIDETEDTPVELSDNEEEIKNTEPEDTGDDESELQKAIAKLKEENNKLHGERSQLSHKVNSLTDLVSKQNERIDSFISTINKPKSSEYDAEEDDDDTYMTKADLKKWQEQEDARIQAVLDKKESEASRYTNAYTDSFAKLSIEEDVDDDLLAEIIKEHDLLAKEGKLGKSTSDPEIDARIAYEKAQNSYLKKMNSQGKVIPFKKAASKVPLGIGNPTGEKEVKSSKSSTAFANLPEDAKAFIASQGLTDDFVKGALAR